MSTKIKDLRDEFEALIKSTMEQAGLKSWDLSKGPTLFKVWGLAEESELLSISYGNRIAFNFVTETGQPFALDVGGFTAPQIKKLKEYLKADVSNGTGYFKPLESKFADIVNKHFWDLV